MKISDGRAHQRLWWHPALSSCTGSRKNLHAHKYRLLIGLQTTRHTEFLYACVCALSPECSVCFSRSSSGESRRGSKWIFWTWLSLASISCLSSFSARDKYSRSVISHWDGLTSYFLSMRADKCVRDFLPSERCGRGERVDLCVTSWQIVQLVFWRTWTTKQTPGGQSRFSSVTGFVSDLP